VVFPGNVGPPRLLEWERKYRFGRERVGGHVYELDGRDSATRSELGARAVDLRLRNGDCNDVGDSVSERQRDGDGNGEGDVHTDDGNFVTDEHRGGRQSNGRADVDRDIGSFACA